MSEVRAADEAVQARHEAISEAISSATGLEQVYRTLFIGMDLDVEDVLAVADDHVMAAGICAIEDAERGRPIDLNTYMSAAWIDGFSVAAMLFLRRAER